MTSPLDLDDAMKCRIFFTTFKESALKWFSHLPVGVIMSFVDFKKMLTTQFVSAHKSLKGSQALLQMRQESSESLRKFIIHFQQKMVEIKDLKPVVAQATLVQGLKEGPFRYAHGFQQPKTLVKLIELTKNRVNVEKYNEIVQRMRLTQAKDLAKTSPLRRLP